MAEQIVSPGVFQRETDQSFITPAPVEVGAAIVGPTVKGPVERPTVVTSFADYKQKFGTTFVSASDNLEFMTSIAVQKYFATLKCISNLPGWLHLSRHRFDYQTRQKSH